MTFTILILFYISFRLKHFICDFVLQSDWMALNKGLSGQEGLRALFSHAGIHAFGTLIIMLFFATSFWWLALVDFAVHGTIDRVKGLITKKNKWEAKDTLFWWALGFDQEMHNFTHLGFIVYIVISSGGLVL